MYKDDIPILTLSSTVTDQLSRLNTLLANAVATDARQSLVFSNSIISLPKLYQETGGELDFFAAKAASALNNYLSNFYENVSVSFTKYGPEEQNFSTINSLLISIEIVSPNAITSNVYSGNVRVSSSGKFEKILLRLNEGI